ncbi:glycosyltransferase family 2 protein [Paenibacillus filicis]|uniref:Glycosyltransferase family 2 protein n=1 Tax=Paenibacillus filicis TaxID=669464 RepID=A0ABU9DDK9_9BACL
MATVSVVMPTWNRAGYLKLAIDSVLEQTFRDFELLVLDDGSIDETPQLVNSYDDSRITYYRHPTRLGMAPNWNFGVEHSQGRYVAFLHDDDEWEPDFLQATIQELELEPAASLAFTDHWLMDQDGRLLADETQANTRRWGRETLEPGLHQPFYELAVVSRPIHIVSMIFRRSVLPSLRQGLESGSVIDYWMVVQLAMEARGAFYIPRRLSRYRMHLGSETATGRMRTCPGYIWMFQELLKEPAFAAYRPYLRRKLAGSFISYGAALMEGRRSKEARKAFVQAYAVERTNQKAIGGMLLSCLPGAVFDTVLRLKRRWMEGT